MRSIHASEYIKNLALIESSLQPTARKDFFSIRFSDLEFGLVFFFSVVCFNFRSCNLIKVCFISLFLLFFPV